MIIDEKVNEWVIIAFAVGFLLSVFGIFAIGFYLGKRSTKRTYHYQLLEEPSAELAPPSNIKGLPPTAIALHSDHVSSTEIIDETTVQTELLHQRLGQLDLKNEEIERTPEFDRALELMNNSNNCIFITGEAGTGKSTLLKFFVANTKKRIVVLSPTGIAAINIGGQTIHSFFRFPPRAVILSDITKHQGEVYRALDAIIIDEVSMVRADLMDAIDKSLRINRDCLDQPFGGVQIILFGDLFQLPPVITKSEEGQYFSQYYRSPYFFDAHVFNNVEIKLIKLKTVYRQHDAKFIEILNQIRTNRINDEILGILNQRVSPYFESKPSDGYIILTTTNRRADIKNAQELEKLPDKVRIYEGDIQGQFDEIFYPTELRLHLKVGAQVMMLTNDAGKRWFNGTVGIVEELSDDLIKIKIPKPVGQPPQIYEVSRHTWQVPRYSIDHTAGILQSEIVGTFIQFPVKLAWAITIHKSQGKTLDRVILDLTDGAFAHGQIYVALSRCIALNGLVLKKAIQKRDIIVDQRVFGFLNRL